MAPIEELRLQSAVYRSRAADIPDRFLRAVRYALARMSHLNGDTMSQESSLTQSARFVRRVLTAHTGGIE